MSITIPSVNKSAFDDVMDALGGNDYSYYLFDVKNVEDKDSTKKVQIALKVFVPQTKRSTAVENLSLIHISEPTRRRGMSDCVICL